MSSSLATVHHFIFVTQVHFCSTYAVALWDWAVCLPQELRLVSSQIYAFLREMIIFAVDLENSLDDSQGLLYFCRYWVIAVTPYLLWALCKDHAFDECRKIFQIPLMLAMVNQVSAEVILLIRTYTFFGRNIYLLALLIAALVGVVAYRVYVVISEIVILPFPDSQFQFQVGPCLPMSKQHPKAHLLGFCIAPLMYVTIITLATVGKAIAIRCQSCGHSSKLLRTFLREGVFYYIIFLIAQLINGIFYLQPGQSISAICIPLSVMLSPVVACRLILDLRARTSEPACDYSGYRFCSSVVNIRPWISVQPNWIR
ncbi:hypothetical protein C8Q75DRAFT_258062 [Abortiporus biennis]|nr:hypothetical protein C8Q75DRAFT_258062 [Abortiporus biennis]